MSAFPTCTRSHLLHSVLSPQLNDPVQVHDELVCEVEESHLEPAAAALKDIMESAFSLSVPLHVSVKYGKTFGNLQPYS